MKQLIFVHGWMCQPDIDSLCKALETRYYNPFEEKKWWKDFLSQELKSTHQIIRPEMPIKQMASYKVWKIWFEKTFPYLNEEELVLVGNSLGAMFLIKYLWENPFPKKIQQLHLIAGVFDESDMSDEEKYAWDFAYSPEIISNLTSKVEQIYMYHSIDDPSVPYSHAQKIKSYLPKATLLTFTDRGHFNQPEFPELLANILHK